MDTKHKVSEEGYTLIEVIIVMAIIAILAGIAIPAYEENVATAQRTDGQSAAMTVMQSQERFFAERLTYSANLTDLGYANSSYNSEEGFYNVTAAACADSTINTCVLVTATGISGNVVGETITLDSQGNKGGSPNIW